MAYELPRPKGRFLSAEEKTEALYRAIGFRIGAYVRVSYRARNGAQTALEGYVHSLHDGLTLVHGEERTYIPFENVKTRELIRPSINYA